MVSLHQVEVSPSQIRLGIYTPNYPGVSGEGGIGSYVRDLAAELTSEGHQVHVLTLGSHPLLWDRNVPIHSVKADYFKLVDRVCPGTGACYHVGKAMRQLVSQFELNVVEFPNWEGLGIYFACRRPVPMVVRLYTSSLETIRIDELEMSRVRRADVRRESFQTRLADVVITHSMAHRQKMAEEMGVDAHRIQIVPLGISPAVPVRCERHSKTIVFLGRLERRKGSVDLLRAAALVIKHDPDARFLLIGADRPHCPGARSHVQYLADEFPSEIRDNVQFLGRLPDNDVQAWLQRATLFVAPSLYESFGLVFLEAMRYGTPVIGTRVGGIPEVVEDGESGVLVPPESPESLAAAILDLLGDPTRRALLGENGRKRFQAQFSVNRMAEQMITIYQHVIQKWRQ